MKKKKESNFKEAIFCDQLDAGDFMAFQFYLLFLVLLIAFWILEPQIVEIFIKRRNLLY
jgi:hypothetical protein